MDTCAHTTRLLADVLLLCKTVDPLAHTGQLAPEQDEDAKKLKQKRIECRVSSKVDSTLAASGVLRRRHGCMLHADLLPVGQVVVSAVRHLAARRALPLLLTLFFAGPLSSTFNRQDAARCKSALEPVTAKPSASTCRSRVSVI